MRPLFPEIDAEIRDDRRAARREETQQARFWLKSKDLVWLVDHLLDNGPQTEYQVGGFLLDQQLDIELFSKRCAECYIGLWALWRIGKFWRVKLAVHPGSGEMSYLFGIRGVHANPSPADIEELRKELVEIF